MGSEQLTVTVLGCDGSFPGPAGACSGYLVRAGGTNLWLDAGSGTMSNLQRYIKLEDIDAIVLTHQHPDHWTDLEGLAIAYKWFLGMDGRPVFAPDGLRDLMNVGIAADIFSWKSIDEGGVGKVGDLKLSFSRTDHSVPTFATRVDCGGRSFGYSADTGPNWGLRSLGESLNLVLCEATFLSDKEGTVQHLSARQAGATASDADVERLVITHLSPGIDRNAARWEAERSFGRPVEVATIGATYEV